MGVTLPSLSSSSPPLSPSSFTSLSLSPLPSSPLLSSPLPLSSYPFPFPLPHLPQSSILSSISLLPLLSSLPFPSYVVRRILRRGVRFCTEKLNAKPGVFASLVQTVVETLVSSSLWNHFYSIHTSVSSLHEFTFAVTKYIHSSI